MSDDERVQFEPLESLTVPEPQAPEPEPAAAAPAAPEPQLAPEPEPAAAPEPEPAAPHRVAAPDSGRQALPFTQADLNLEFEPLAREGRTYVARLARGGLLTVTPPCALASPLTDEAGAPEPFVWLRPTAAFGKFVADVEERLLAAAVRNKLEWLRKDVPDDALRSSFKSFVREDGAVRVKSGEGLAAFSADRAPADPALVRGPRVRCVLALRQLTFGKTEFGGCWRLVQVLDVPDAECMIQDSPAETDSEIEDFV